MAPGIFGALAAGIVALIVVSEGVLDRLGAEALAGGVKIYRFDR